MSAMKYILFVLVVYLVVSENRIYCEDVLHTGKQTIKTEIISGVWLDNDPVKLEKALQRPVNKFFNGIYEINAPKQFDKPSFLPLFNDLRLPESRFIDKEKEYSGNLRERLLLQKLIKSLSYPGTDSKQPLLVIYGGQRQQDMEKGNTKTRNNADYFWINMLKHKTTNNRKILKRDTPRWPTKSTVENPFDFYTDKPTSTSTISYPRRWLKSLVQDMEGRLKSVTIPLNKLLRLPFRHIANKTASPTLKNETVLNNPNPYKPRWMRRMMRKVGIGLKSVTDPFYSVLKEKLRIKMSISQLEPPKNTSQNDLSNEELYERATTLTYPRLWLRQLAQNMEMGLNTFANPVQVLINSRSSTKRPLRRIATSTSIPGRASSEIRPHKRSDNWFQSIIKGIENGVKFITQPIMAAFDSRFKQKVPNQ